MEPPNSRELSLESLAKDLSDGIKLFSRNLCLAAAPDWCSTMQVDDDIQICLPAAANISMLQRAWGQGIDGFRSSSDFLERNCDVPASWVGDNFMCASLIPFLTAEKEMSCVVHIP